jgi:hypothetical protein
MLKRLALRKFISLTVISAAVAVVALPYQDSHAGDIPGTNAPRYAPRTAPNHSGPGIGGYSMTLSDIWGPAEMPPTPKDFGPHFDFQPEPLSGGLSHDPYPN